MSRYGKLIEKALAPDDFASAAQRGEPCISIASNSMVYIDGHRGILSYEPEKVVVAFKRGEIIVMGMDLRLSAFGREYVKIKGLISSVEMREGK